MIGRIPAALLLGIGVIGAVPAPGFSATQRAIPVLIYHQFVTDTTAPGETVIRLERFAEQMRWLREHRYSALTLDQFAAVVGGERPVPSRAVVITIDDGWKSGLLAVPILKQHRLNASFWIIAGPRGIGDPYLTWPEIEAIDRDPLFEVASHTMSHPWNPRDNLVTWMDGTVPGRSREDVRHELAESKRLLEEHLGRPVTQLAWPCGWFTDAMVDLAREAGYTMILTAADGLNGRGADPLRIRRTFVDGACDLASFIASVRDGGYRVCQTQNPPTLGHLPPGYVQPDSMPVR